jgi:2,4-dienoyl-CoA reductase-like NADH-dependent reductase (Old Yellow Enzyme family)
MKKIFDQTSINGMSLKNRFIRSATWEGMCDEKGCPTDKLIHYYQTLASGGVGLIITGYSFISLDSKQAPGQMGAHTEEFSKKMRCLTSAVHQSQGKICIQLVHTGGRANTSLSKTQPIAPSAINSKLYSTTPRSMSREDILNVIGNFGQAAKRARDWGFDAVELHGAHGYLINQFLSPNTNKRTDEYGGSIENRTRFALEIYHQVRKKVGSKFPIMIKLSANDNISSGLTTSDSIYAAQALDRVGIDAIEISSGSSISGDKSPARKITRQDEKAYNLHLAKKIKQKINCPIAVVGGFRSIKNIKKAVEKDGIDYISIARPFIREPGLINKWESGNIAPAKCISCNGCFKPGLEEGGIYCPMEADQKKLRGLKKIFKWFSHQ